MLGGDAAQDQTGRRDLILLCLDLVYHIQYYHAFGSLRGIIFKFSTGSIATPYLKRCIQHYFISSIMSVRSARI